MRYARFEVTDKAIGVCAIDYRPIHKQKCLAYGADLFCAQCLQEMLNLAVEHGLVELPRQEKAPETETQEEPAEELSAYTCPVCGKQFATQQALIAHRRKH